MMDDSWQFKRSEEIADRCQMYELILRNIFEWSESAIAQCVANRRHVMTQSESTFGTELHEYPAYLLINDLLPADYYSRFDLRSRVAFENKFKSCIHKYFYNEFVDPSYDWDAAKKRVFEFLAQHGIRAMKR